MNRDEDNALRLQKKSAKALKKIKPVKAYTEGDRRERHLFKAYKLTRGDYNDLFVSQQGCCAICGVHQSELKKPLFVDHCHKTGLVRGLLCSNCNLALGYLQDDPQIVEIAKEYLLKNVKRLKFPD